MPQKTEKYIGLVKGSFEQVDGQLTDRESLKLQMEPPRKFPVSLLRYPGGKTRGSIANLSWILASARMTFVSTVTQLTTLVSTVMH